MIELNTSAGIYVNKTDASKKCDICHYWYLLYEGYKFQSNVCSWCHQLLTMTINLKDIAILHNSITDLLQNADCNQRRGTL